MVEARSTGGLLGDIRTHLLHEADRPTDRRQDVIHPSEMASHDWCPRATYYRIRDVRAGVEVKGEKHRVNTLSIFEEGHHIHRKYQGWLRKMGVLKGRWDCRECKARGVAFPDDPGQCPRCGSVSGVVYGEVPLDAIKEALIGGHADGWVSTGLIEIKSIGKGTVRMDAPDLYKKHTLVTTTGKKLFDIEGLWNEIARPFPAHIKQANIYLWIAKLMGIPVGYMEFIYESKAHQGTKNFVIKLSDRVMAPLLEKAHSIKDGLETGKAPSRGFSNSEKNPCKSCEWRSECWKEDDADDSPEPERGDSRHRKAAGAEGKRSARGNVRAGTARRRSLTDSPRRDGARRRSADVPVPRNGGVGELSRDETQRSSGGRKVRRKRPGNPPGVSSP